MFEIINQTNLEEAIQKYQKKLEELKPKCEEVRKQESQAYDLFMQDKICAEEYDEIYKRLGSLDDAIYELEKIIEQSKYLLEIATNLEIYLQNIED